MIAEQRIHDDLFTDEEAAVYLRLEGVRSLDFVEQQFKLPHYTFGRRRIYYRDDLDAAALKMMGKDKDQPKTRNRGQVAGGTR